MQKVILSEVNEYNLEKIQKVIDEHFNILKPNIKSGMTVVIKPNLVMKASSDSVIITNPIVVTAVGLAVKNLGANVLIAESSGGVYTPVSTKIIFKACGYTEIAEKYGFELYTECEHELVEFPSGRTCKSFNVVKPFINADFIIDIAKLKSHGMTVYSGAIKNLFGVVPGLMKPELHFRYESPAKFSDMVVDLCELIKPNLCIIDAINVMEGNGPTGGTSKFCGLIMSSENPYNLDTVASSLAGFKINDIPMLVNAKERNLLKFTPKELVDENIYLDKYIMHDFKRSVGKPLDFMHKVPKIFKPILKKFVATKPVVRKNECIGCGKCAESCPAKTITMKNNKAVINYKNCICCFCCHEMCPKHIIDYKKFTLFKF